MPTKTPDQWAKCFLAHQARLINVARRHLPPILAARLTPEDIVQDTLADACHKLDFFEQRPEVPLYCKLRFLVLQQITTMERYHLQSQKRDAYKEISVAEGDQSTARLNWNAFADTATGQYTRLAREDRHALLHQAIDALSENDRQIIELRAFDGMSNSECAEALGIEQKAASIRYVRALQRLRDLLNQYSEFRS